MTEERISEARLSDLGGVEIWRNSTFAIALGASVILLGLRLEIARATGFGDSEALYACYALHPQPAYLDHPGLIGSIARVIGRGNVPRPELAHLYTSVLATLVPWLGGWAARVAGASFAGVLRTVIALLFVPELSIGLFGMTPDLPLAICWIGTLGLISVWLNAPPGSFKGLVAMLLAGVLAGLGTLSKATGALLIVILLFTMLTREGRRRFFTLGPWGALAASAVLVTPVAVWEWRQGFPMLVHRLITQAGPFSWLRNLGLFLGGQLAYVTPPYLFACALIFVDLFRKRNSNPISSLFRIATLVPAVALGALSIWSQAAEPHWFAPAYIALAIQFGRAAPIGRRLSLACVSTGAAITALAFIWVKTPLPMRVLGHAYRPRFDLANDLYAWGPGRRLLENAVAQATLDSRRVPIVVGPHWIVCAQAHAALGNRVPVGCNGPRKDDFDRWLPRDKWLQAPSILFVHDSRFPIDPEKELPGRSVRASSRVDIVRGGMTVRTIWVTHLEKSEDVGLREPP